MTAGKSFQEPQVEHGKVFPNFL